MTDQPYDRGTFNRWCERNGGENLISNVARIWNEDANVARQKLYELFEYGSSVHYPALMELRAEVDGLKRALDAKQHIEVSFSLFSIFKRKSP